MKMKSNKLNCVHASRSHEVIHFPIRSQLSLLFSALFLDCGYSVDNSRRAGALEDFRTAIDSIQRLSLRCCPVNCDLHWSFHLPDLVLGMLRRNPIEHLLARDLFDFPAHPCAFSDHLSLLRLLVRR